MIGTFVSRQLFNLIVGSWDRNIPPRPLRVASTELTSAKINRAALVNISYNFLTGLNFLAQLSYITLYRAQFEGFSVPTVAMTSERNGLK